MRDFSYKIYAELIGKLLHAGYIFQTMEDFIADPAQRALILRHDIDITAISALRLAKLEKHLGVRGTYYFRTTKHSFRPSIIQEIAKLGHEIGYHYEDLTRNNGDFDSAIKDFEIHLESFRLLYPVKTVCMHGRSGSPYDNRDLWKSASLSDFGLLAEPYISLDFDKVLYVSDTSHRWDGGGVAVRDNVVSGLGLSFRTTFDIMGNIDKIPNHFMITIHPELWTKCLPGWLFVKLYVFAHSNYKKYYRNRKVRKQMERRGMGEK